MPSYKDVVISGPLTAFGEVEVAENTPEIQLDATQGLKTQQEVEVFTGTTGSVTVEDTGTGYEFCCTTGTAVGGYGLVRSQRAVRYRPGQGVVIRFTARFSTGIPLSTQRAGGVTLGNELTFGYDGEDFGILIRNSGKPEIRKLTVTVGATGNETAIITLNGIATNVSLTVGNTLHTATEIGATTFAGWNVTVTGSVVTFLAASVDAKSGTYSMSSDGDAAGTFAQLVSGASVNDTWIKQTAWNVNRCDGSGDFAFSLNPTRGNVFEIKMQYLGYGNIDFFVENPADGHFQLVHRHQYPNKFSSPSLTQPEFKIGIFAASLGSTTDISCYAGSFYGANQGKIVHLNNPDGHANTQSGVGTSLTNVLSIRVRLEINAIINLREIIPLIASFAADGTKNVIVELLLNPTITGDPNWTLHEGNESDSIVEVMTTSVVMSINQGTTIELGTYALGKVGSEVLDLSSLDIDIKRGDVLSLVAKTVSGTSEITGSLIWKEK